MNNYQSTSSLGRVSEAVFNNGEVILSPKDKIIQIDHTQFECELVDGFISFKWIKPDNTFVELCDE